MGWTTFGGSRKCPSISLSKLYFRLDGEWEYKKLLRPAIDENVSGSAEFQSIYDQAGCTKINLSINFFMTSLQGERLLD